MANSLTSPIISYTKQAKFDEVRDDLKAAIENRGLIIDATSFIARMLERTGKDLGAAKPLYSDGQAFVFCSASLSRRAMEADPANMSMCPYSIVVYATASAPDRVIVSYRSVRRPESSAASRSALGAVDALLDAIAREATGTAPARK